VTTKKKTGRAAPNELETTRVQFGTLSIGDHTARLSVSITRASSIPLSKIDILCSHTRCNVALWQLEDDPADRTLGDDPDDDGERALRTVVDITGFRGTHKVFAFGLTFVLEEIELEALVKFAKQEGLLELRRIGDIPEQKETPDPSQGTLEPAPLVELYREGRLDEADLSVASLNGLKDLATELGLPMSNSGSELRDRIREALAVPAT